MLAFPTCLNLPHQTQASMDRSQVGGHLPGRGGLVPIEHHVGMAVFTLQFLWETEHRLSCRDTMEVPTKEF